MGMFYKQLQRLYEMRLLIVGKTGVGKTWLMKALIEHYKVEKRLKLGKFYFHTNGEIVILGKYDGSTFEGTDKLSMAIMADLDLFLCSFGDKTIITEGDRFTNSTFINNAKPIIIKILGDGAAGRLKRQSTQSERHIKSISTRVNNIIPTFEVENSTEALILIKNLIK